MGEAKNRRDAMRFGQPLPEDWHRCPSCASRRTVVEQAPALALSHVPTLMGCCADCGTVWEAYPSDWKHDVCEAEPCDNCAFRGGSPESGDRAEWRNMLTKLRAGGQEFRCHKGAPLVIDKEASTVEFDEAWVQRQGRMCAGFHRIMVTWPDWLANRYSGVAHVLTAHDQDKLLAEGAADIAIANAPEGA